MQNKEVLCFVNNDKVDLKLYLLEKLVFDDNEKVFIGNEKYVDIVFIKEGFGNININENNYPICKNCCILLQKNKKSEIESVKNLSLLHICFEEKNIEKIISEYLCYDQTVFNGNEMELPFEKMFELHRESQVVCAKNYPIIPLILEIVFSAIKHTNFGIDVSSLAKNTIEYLNANVIGKPSLDELSKKFNLTKAQIIREFEKYYKITPYQYLLNAKIELSANYLKYTDLSVKEIAKLLNFADEHYFSDSFKKKMNISPLKYRKSN